ncbi:MAG: NADH-quinone oxidoreductase subunit NuoN [Pseudomonadota bacterium]
MDFALIIDASAPELLLAAMGLAGVLAGALLGDRFAAVSYRLAAIGLFAAAGLAGVNYGGGEAFNGLVLTTPFASFAKIISFGAAGAALLMAEGFMRRQGTLRYEFALLSLFAALGMGVILSAADLMTLYMGIETLSLSSYVLAAFHRDSARSAEAGLKYFVLGALASGLLLYGGSLVYGLTGSTAYTDIARVAGSEDLSIGLTFGMVLMISGLAFKVSAAPMHVWTPDVYEGAPTPVVAFFASAPKMASMAVFALVLFTAFGTLLVDWKPILAIIAGASMLIGAFGALAQDNIKRLLAYSSIANIGYALVPVAVGAEIGGGPLLIFMTLYVIASLGLFAGVLAMRRSGGMVEDVNELSGLVRTQPALALSLLVLIFSVAGIPPFAGFWGKVEVVRAGLSGDLMPLVIILIISSVVSLGYYLRLVRIMWFADPRERFEAGDMSVSAVVAITAIATLVLTVFFGQLDVAADLAARSLYS